MEASTSADKPPHGRLPRPGDGHPAGIGRTKRSNSGSFVDPSMPRNRGPLEAPYPPLGEEPELFIPSTLGEHLLESTYLVDVVKPLVRSLVCARMRSAHRDQSEDNAAHLFADLDRLRHELERSVQGRRNAERERDDLARRLDRVAPAGDTSHGRDPGSAYPAYERGLAGHPRGNHARDASPGASNGEAILPHLRGNNSLAGHGPRPTAPGDVSGSGAEVGPGGAGTTPQDAGIEGGYPRTGRGDPSPMMAYSSAHSRPRSYIDAPPLERDRHGLFPSRGPPLPSHSPPYDHPDAYGSGPYLDERYSQSGPSRPSMHRYSSGAMPGSLMSMQQQPHRSSGLALPPYSSPRSHAYGLGPYESGVPVGDSDMHDLDGEGPRKQAKLHPGANSGESPLRPPSASGRGPPGVYAMNGPPDASFLQTRKLAATKNRTCSNCAAPHDAKFRRGPNGPGTLCDRCGSRWKKYKETEAAAIRGREGGDSSAGGSHSHSGQHSDSRSPEGGPLASEREREGDVSSSRHGAGHPQYRQKLPPHLAPGASGDRGPSPPPSHPRARTGNGAGAGGEGGEAASAGPSTPMHPKREEGVPASAGSERAAQWRSSERSAAPAVSSDQARRSEGASHRESSGSADELID